MGWAPLAVVVVLTAYEATGEVRRKRRISRRGERAAREGDA